MGSGQQTDELPGGTRERDHGAAAARELYDNWDPDVVFQGQFTQEFAEAFIDEISAIQAARANSVDRVSSKRAGRSAGQLTEQEFREILEVLQNAEDEEAGYLSVVLRRNGRHKELLFVHDGNRVSAPSVVAMSGAYLTGKEESADKIGKFGIGLKTLQRLGPRVEVHCAPYHWAFTDGDITRVAPAEEVPDVYDPSSGQTLILLRLQGKLVPDDLFDWFTRTGARTLLFLKHVRKFDYREIGTRPRYLSRHLTETQNSVYALTVGHRVGECCEALLESQDGEYWRRYVIDLPTAKHERRGKAAGPTVRLAVAVPAEGQPGLLFSGLPTGEGIALPFDIGGPFESDVSRERVDASSPWNSWLLDEMRKFVQAVALRELLEEPKRAWPLIGLHSDIELHPPRKWLSGEILLFVERIQRAVAAGELVIANQHVRVRDLSYESADLESSLNADDVESVRPGSCCLPSGDRDGGRWRSVLTEVVASGEVKVDEALVLFEHPFVSAKKPTWFIALAAAAIKGGVGDALFSHQSVLLADGEQVAPCKDGNGSLLVSKVLSGTDLVTRLSLASQIHPAYAGAGESAKAVRSFLVERGAFSDEHSADAVLRALAGRKAEPVALKDEDLGELATFIGETAPETVAALSQDLGLAVTVDGFEWIEGKRSYRQVRPSEAYLPAAMDKEGWATAAGQTEGIAWIHPRYAKVKQFADTDIGARKLLRRMGAEIAPRLQRPETKRWNYGETAYSLGWSDLPELWNRSRRTILERTGNSPEVLTDDWTSQDMLAVAADIARSKIDTERRERAAALIKALERGWTRLYEDRSDSPALYSVRKWYPTGAVMPTAWVARLAGIEWLSDCARRPSPTAPVNTRIRSDANASVYGDDATAYAYELGPDDADSQVVRALGIGGLPRASEHLEALRVLKASGREVTWRDVAHHYVALSAMCPMRPTSRAEVDDITVARLLRSFAAEKLLWCGGWLSPAAVYRGEMLFPGEAAFVPEEEEFSGLWETLGIKEPTDLECVGFLKRWASEDATPEELGEALPRTYRALAGLTTEPSRLRKSLSKLPIWVGDRWVASRPVYYAESEVFAKTLSGSAVPMWRLPCALYALGDLPEHLGLELISPAAFAVGARGGLNSVFDSTTSERFERAAELMREFVSQWMPAVYAEVSDAAWEALACASVELVPGLMLEGRVGKGRVVVQASAHFDHKEGRFYFEHPSQIGRRDLGGALVADSFDVVLADRLQLSLAWVDSWQRASEGDEQVYFPIRRRTPAYIDGDAVPGSPPMTAIVTVPTKKKAQAKGAVTSLAKRRLVDVDTLVTGALRPASIPPEGTIVTDAVEVVLEKPRAANPGNGGSDRTRKPVPGYSEWDRETAGLRILQRVLADKGVRIEDARSERTGADCLATDGRYYELKVHAGSASGPMAMQSSQVLQARELGDRYVLTIVENVEATQSNPRVTFIPNPLMVLKVRPLGKTEVSGYDNEAFEQIELTASERPA